MCQELGIAHFLLFHFFKKISQDVRARAHLLVVRKMRRKNKKKKPLPGWPNMARLQAELPSLPH
jgi:hypothetical protein